MKYLKLIAVVITIMLLNSCKSENKKDKKDKKNEIISYRGDQIVSDLPIGTSLLINIKLPEKITYQYDSKGGLNTQNGNLLDSLSTLSSSYYDGLKINKNLNFKELPLIKTNIIYNKSDKNNMIYFLDSCYYSKTIFNNGTIKLKLFKDGKKYNKEIGNENNSITNYITLGVYNNKNKLTDYKTVYYDEKLYFSNNSMYFFLDKDLKLSLHEYQTEEEGIKLVSKKKYQINNQGKFILINENFITNSEDDSKNKNLTKNISFFKEWEGIYWLSPFESDKNIIGNYYVDYFKDNQDFGLSGGENSFSLEITTTTENNKLYIFKKEENDFNIKNAIVKITKIGTKYFISGKKIKIERNDIFKNEFGYLINWAKKVEDIED